MKALYLLLAIHLVWAQGAEDEEGPVIAALKTCSDQVKPSEDDMTEISVGELKSSSAKTMITCLLKGAKVMLDKEFHKENAVEFFKALVPGDSDKDDIEKFKKISETCATSVASKKPKQTATEEEIAEVIYDCMVKEGRSMGLSADADDTPSKPGGKGKS